MQRAPLHRRFDDLLHDEADKQRHADFVHPERERLGQAEVRLGHGVGPHERDRHPQRQAEEPVHRAVNGVRRMLPMVVTVQRDVMRGGHVASHCVALVWLAWRRITPESTVVPERATASKNSSSPATSTSMKALSWSK